MSENNVFIKDVMLVNMIRVQGILDSSDISNENKQLIIEVLKEADLHWALSNRASMALVGAIGSFKDGAYTDEIIRRAEVIANEQMDISNMYPWEIEEA